MIEEIYQHALEVAPEECCGLVIVVKGKEQYIRCENILHSAQNFIMNPEDYANAEDIGTITHIVHSHPSSIPEPSQTDMIGIEQTQLPWIIVNPYSKHHTITNPSGWVLPLIGRQFHHGIIDCLTLVQDYYKQNLNITLPQYERPDLWWELGMNLYEEHFPSAGFYEVRDGSIKEHDMILMKVGSSKTNHAAIYIGNNKIIHHPMGRLSTIDIYGGWWQKITAKVVRHKDVP